MAMQRAVVSTESGCAGLGLLHGHSAWIADTPEAFAAGIATLIADPDRRRVLIAPGDVVEAGQGLIVVEAMKMQNEMKAARAGRTRAFTKWPASCCARWAYLRSRRGPWAPGPGNAICPRWGAPVSVKRGGAGGIARLHPAPPPHRVGPQSVAAHTRSAARAHPHPGGLSGCPRRLVGRAH